MWPAISIVERNFGTCQGHRQSRTLYHNRFTALFPGPSGCAGARRELLDFMVQGQINRGRHTDHRAGRHSIQTNQCPPPPSPDIFYGPDALPASLVVEGESLNNNNNNNKPICNAPDASVTDPEVRRTLCNITVRVDH